MIKIDDEFSMTRDAYGWTVHQTIVNTGKRSKHATRNRDTYHSNITQCLCSILDRSCSKAHTLEDVKQLVADFERKVEVMTRGISAKAV